MSFSKVIVYMFPLTMMIMGVSGVSGQTYPNKPIRIVAAEPGGGVDTAARMIALGLTGGLGQPVIVENRGGANGAIAAQVVAKAPPDGYTLLFYSNVIWFVPLMKDSVPYSMEDFSPVSLTTLSPNILVVHPSLPVNSVKELIALAKAKPGQLNYAHVSSGAASHLAGALFKAMTGVDMLNIPYKGTAQALVDLMSGQTQLMFPNAAVVPPHLKSGKLRALAVTSAQPSALFPGLPTVAGSGLPGYEIGSVQGIFAPAKTPAAIISQLNVEIVRYLNRVDVKKRFLETGVETVGSSPEEFAATIKSDVAKMGKIIKDAGIRAE